MFGLNSNHLLSDRPSEAGCNKRMTYASHSDTPEQAQ